MTYASPAPSSMAYASGALQAPSTATTYGSPPPSPTPYAFAEPAATMTYASAAPSTQMTYASAAPTTVTYASGAPQVQMAYTPAAATTYMTGGSSAFATPPTTALPSAPSMIAMPGYQMAPQTPYATVPAAASHHTGMMEKVHDMLGGHHGASNAQATSMSQAPVMAPVSSTIEGVPMTTTSSVVAPTTYATSSAVAPTTYVTSGKKSKKIKSKKASKGGCC